MASRIKAHLTEILGASTSLLGAITANQEKIEWGLRCFSYAGSGIAAVATIYVIIRNGRAPKKV